MELFFPELNKFYLQTAVFRIKEATNRRECSIRWKKRVIPFIPEIRYNVYIVSGEYGIDKDREAATKFFFLTCAGGPARKPLLIAPNRT